MEGEKTFKNTFSKMLHITQINSVKMHAVFFSNVVCFIAQYLIFHFHYFEIYRHEKINEYKTERRLPH